MKFNKTLSIVLISLLVCQPLIIATTRSLRETRREKGVRKGQGNVVQLSKKKLTPSQSQGEEKLLENTPTSIKEGDNDNEVGSSLATIHRDPSLSNNVHVEEEEADPITTQQINEATFWVKAGSNGNGTGSARPAGNITYVLSNYNLTNAVVKVEEGTYDSTLENFPLVLNYENMTLTSVDNSNVTVIEGRKNEGILQIRENNATIQNFTLLYGFYGMALEADYTTVIGNNITDCKYGIWLRHASKNTLSGNLMEECGLFLEGEKTTVTQQTISTTNLVNGKPVRYYSNQGTIGVPTNTGQVILADTNDSTISGLNLSHTTVGIQLLYSHNNVITSGTYSNDVYGVWLGECSENTIVNNIITNNINGISLSNTNDNTITENTLNTTRNAIYLNGTSNTMISNNSITENKYNTYLAGSTNSTLTENTIHGGEYGIYLSNSSSTITANNITNCSKDNIFLADAENTRITGNRIANGGQGGIYLTTSTNTTIKGNTITNASNYGIIIDASHKGKIAFNEMVNCSEGGIAAWNSTNYSIKKNDLVENGQGILLDGTQNSQAIHNEISNNMNGILIVNSTDSTIRGNNITYNREYGIHIYWYATNNTIYRNNFVGNHLNADEWGGNAFNNSTIGNYWFGYKGTGDTPYKISGGNSKDYKPQPDPFGTSETTAPELTIQSPTTGKKFTRSNVTVEWTGDDAQSPPVHFLVRINEGKWFDAGKNTSYTFDALTSGKYTVTVASIDQALNSNLATITFKIELGGGEDGGVSNMLIASIVIGVIIVIAGVVYFIKRR